MNYSIVVLFLQYYCKVCQLYLMFLSVSHLKTVALWDLRNLKLKLHSFESHKDEIFQVGVFYLFYLFSVNCISVAIQND